MTFNLKKIIFPLATFFLLTIGFYSNSFNTADKVHFKNFQTGDNSYVIGRLVISERDGIFSHGGFNGRVFYPNITDSLVRSTNQTKAYLGELEVKSNKFVPYFSQSGGQGMLYSILDSISPFENSKNLSLFRLINSILFALSLTLFLIWIKSEFGLTTSLITLFLILVSFWLTIFGNKIWWALWAFYTPLIVLLNLFKNENKKTLSTKKIAITCYLLVALKCFFNGFEYITAFLIMITIPLIFYGVINKWKLSLFLKRFFTISIASILAVFTSLIILIYQISLVKGSISNGVKHILMSYAKRTNSGNVSLPEVFQKSVDAPLSDILQSYWNITALDFSRWTNSFWDDFLKIDFGELILIFIIFTALGLISKKLPTRSFKTKRRNKALIIATWTSFMAPLSWFIVFKGHSYIHVHMNAIVWYMPFCLFGFIQIGTVISGTLNDLILHYNRLSKKIKIAFKLAFIALGVSLLFIYLIGSFQSIQKFKTASDAKNLIYQSDKLNLYLMNQELLFLNKSNENINLDARFFLHVTPTDKLALPEARKIHGFDNLDFNCNSNKLLNLPWWSSYSINNAFYKQLPDYEIKLLRIGQFNKNGKIWDSKPIEIR